MGTAKLHHGSCLDVLPTIPSGSVDVVLTDPPYPCIDRSYGRWTEDEWFAMMRVVVPECMRVLKPSGSAVFILQPNSERVGRMRTWLWKFMAWVGEEYGIVQDVWWLNTAAMPEVHSIQGRLMRCSIKACIWLGQSDCFRDQSGILWQESHRNVIARLSSRASKECHPSGHSVDRQRISSSAESRGGVTPYNVLPIPNTDSQSSAGSFGHGAGTPLPLANWWIRYICPPGGMVLDPFSGTATMGLAALSQWKNYIGIERIDEYHQIAQKRMDHAESQPSLFDYP